MSYKHMIASGVSQVFQFAWTPMTCLKNFLEAHRELKSGDADMNRRVNQISRLVFNAVSLAGRSQIPVLQGANAFSDLAFRTTRIIERLQQDGVHLDDALLFDVAELVVTCSLHGSGLTEDQWVSETLSTIGTTGQFAVDLRRNINSSRVENNALQQAAALVEDCPDLEFTAPMLKDYQLTLFWIADRMSADEFAALKGIPFDVLDDPVFRRWQCPITGFPIRHPVRLANGRPSLVFERAALELFVETHPGEKIPGTEILAQGKEMILPSPHIERQINQRLEVIRRDLRIVERKRAQERYEENLQRLAQRLNYNQQFDPLLELDQIPPELDEDPILHLPEFSCGISGKPMRFAYKATIRGRNGSVRCDRECLEAARSGPPNVPILGLNCFPKDIIGVERDREAQVAIDQRLLQVSRKIMTIQGYNVQARDEYFRSQEGFLQTVSAVTLHLHQGVAAFGDTLMDLGDSAMHNEINNPLDLLGWGAGLFAFLAGGALKVIAKVNTVITSRAFLLAGNRPEELQQIDSQYHNNRLVPFVRAVRRTIIGRE